MGVRYKLRAIFVRLYTKLSRPVVYPAIRSALQESYRDLSQVVDIMVMQDSARYIIDNMPMAKDLQTQEGLLLWALDEAKCDGLLLEFGVWKGRTIRPIAEHVNQTVYGFDSFEGVDVDWTPDTHMRHFDLGGRLPEVPGNVQLVKGYFEDTLPLFTSEHTNPVRFLHIDSDIYQSAKTVLEGLTQQIIPGTIIVFDEYLKYRGWQFHEYKAYQEWVKRTM